MFKLNGQKNKSRGHPSKNASCTISFCTSETVFLMWRRILYRIHSPWDCAKELLILSNWKLFDPLKLHCSSQVEDHEVSLEFDKKLIEIIMWDRCLLANTNLYYNANIKIEMLLVMKRTSRGTATSVPRAKSRVNGW